MFLARCKQEKMFHVGVGGTFSSERLAIGETIDTFWSRFLFFLLRFGDPSLFVSQAFVFILGTVMMSPRNTKRYM